MRPFYSLASRVTTRRSLHTAITVAALMMSACTLNSDDVTDPECETYCDASLDACRGDNAVFTERSHCLDACADIKRGGQVGDARGDTLQCRLTRLEYALSDPVIHCPHSQPEPHGTCTDQMPTRCDRYCALMLESCYGVGLEVYTDRESCLLQCNGFVLGEAGTVGDTLACRVDQLFDPPLDLSPADQCKEAGPESTICVDADEREPVSE